MIRDRSIPVFSHKKITKGIFLLTLKSKEICAAGEPGQFVQIKIDGHQAYLRRPLSIHRVRGDLFSLLYKIKGEGTRALSEKQKGENVRVLGPLGKGFTLERRVLKRFDKMLVVAGGIGIAPLIFLLDRLKGYQAKEPEVFFGACTDKDLVLKDELTGTGFPVHYATEDCSFGAAGKITHLLEKRLQKLLNKKVLIYACGPEAMYCGLQKMTKRFPLVMVEVLFERMMGCGFGVCNSCSILTRDGMKKVCTDGPAFNLAEVVLGDDHISTA